MEPILSSTEVPKVEEIVAITFRCTPLRLNDSKQLQEIRSMEVVIYAKSEEEASIILYNRTQQFFDQNLNIVVTSRHKGYRQVE
jgi:C4-type Zn-finger protein